MSYFHSYYASTVTTIVNSGPTSIGKFNEYWIPIVTGLAVAFIPFAIKYLNRKFEQITSTAQDVERHHKQNKKRLNKLDRELKLIKANQSKTPDEVKSSSQT